MNKKLLVLPIALFLFGCGKDASSSTEITTFYKDMTSQSIYGRLSEFSIESSNVKPGDTLTFTATPAEDFNCNGATNNGTPCTAITSPDPVTGAVKYQTTITAGVNKLIGNYSVDPNIDFVENFKLNISDEVFDAVINQKDGLGDKNAIDFRRSGIEKMGAPWKYNSSHQKVTNSKVFMNYVDGDTTHVETSNLGYTVKIRYLGIDTPESTSEIEEWGFTASCYNKYIFSADAANYGKYLDEPTKAYADTHCGATYIILQSQQCALHGDEYTLSELNDPTCTKYQADTDGYQRNLSYVWYATTENPTKNDFRCLNLEMVYMGFSFAAINYADQGEYFYKMFNKADLSAEAHFRHLYSNDVDENYWYYEDTDNYSISTLTMRQIYASSTQTDSRIKYLTDSPYADKKTLYRIKGYVSRKVGQSFYMQNKPSYTQEEIDEGKVYGLYVFTLRDTPIIPGDEVEVVGALTEYGGTYQLQGISYHEKANRNLIRDTVIKSRGNTIVPIEVTGAQFNQLKLPQILVKITDNVYPYEFQTMYSGNYESINEGGSEEINKYNEFYPFYNTSNTPIFFASYGQEDNAQQINEAGRSSSTTNRYTDDVIRFTTDENVLISYGTEYCYSYKFFTGGSYYYNPNGAEYANLDETNPYKDETILREYSRKYLTDVVCISKGYQSTGGNRKMCALLAAASDLTINVL